MPAYKLTVKQLENMLNNREISAPEIVDSFLKRINQIDDKVKAFVTITDEVARNKAKQLEKSPISSRLNGIPYSLKDNICTDGVKTTCSSKMLEDFIPNYDATVVSQLKKAGGILLGKLNLDEFALGTSTEQSAFFPTRNPWDLSRVPGGSSGGAAAAVAADETPFALATDTGGSIRQPASYCGVVGLKPSYGRVSRLGVMAVASSFDQVGIISKNVEDSAIVLGRIAGKDYQDSTSLDAPVPDYTAFLTTDIKGMKIAYPKEFFVESIDKEVRATVIKALHKYEELGAIVEEVSIPNLEYALAIYHIIAAAEFSTNLARLDGIRYGFNDKSADNLTDMYLKNRGLSLGAEVKRRTLFGSFVLSADNYERYYLQALKIRNLIYQDVLRLLANYGIIVSPTTPNTAFKIGEQAASLLELYNNDILTVTASIAGLPAISIPCGFVDNLPVGMQLMGKSLDEGQLIKAAYAFEQHTSYHQEKPDLGVN